MHELGIARAIAEAIRENGWHRARLEVRVTDSHASPSEFDRALLAHLESNGTDLDATQITISHRATVRTCSRCAQQFQPGMEPEDCPACGGPALPPAGGDEVELILISAGVSPCA